MLLLLRTLFFSLCLLSFITPSRAQLYAKVLQFRPTGDFGFVAEKALGAEIGYIGEFDEPFRSRFYFNFGSFQSRMETFPGVGYSNQGGTNTFYPGENQYKTLINILSGVGYDYSPDFFDDYKLRPYLGADFNFGFHIRETRFNNPAISDVSESGGGVAVGVKGRVGIQYAFKNCGLFFDISRTFAIFIPYSFANFNDVGLGFYYNL